MTAWASEEFRVRDFDPYGAAETASFHCEDGERRGLSLPAGKSSR